MPLLDRPFIIAKHYEVTDFVLGRGGFSTVHLAYQTIFHNKVALKIINRNEIKEEYVSRNLRREAKLLMKLNHPNIVKFYQELSQNELYCLALEYIEGLTLNQYLKKQDSFRVSEKTAKTLFSQMISAVYHMHQRKIIHRDLKLENILLENEKVIKIIDFGLSNTFHNKTQLRTHCGSVAYAAPELFQNRSVYGTAVDLWSLGIILYVMVIGKLPFKMTKNEGECSSNNQRRELFSKRISQGLTQDNWEDMKMLSKDCCNLLKSLLQPNQFKRISVKSALMHSWFYNDHDLNGRLPQFEPDLREELTWEITEFMAERLHKTGERIRTHLKNYKFDTIYSIFHMLLDTLMKETLYSKVIREDTVSSEFRTWKRNYEVKRREEKEKRMQSCAKSNSTARYFHFRNDPEQISSFTRPVYSYDVREFKKNSFRIKNSSDIHGFNKRRSGDISNQIRIWEPDVSKSKTTKNQSYYNTNNPGLGKSFGQVDNDYSNTKVLLLKTNKGSRLREISETDRENDEKNVMIPKDSEVEENWKSSNYRLKSYKYNRPDKNASKELTDEKSVKLHKDNGIEENEEISNNILKLNENDGHRNYTKTKDTIGEKSLAFHKYSEIEEPEENYLYPLKSYRPDKSACTELIHGKSVKLQEDNGIEENKKFPNNILKLYKNDEPRNYATTEHSIDGKRFALLKYSKSEEQEKNSVYPLKSDKNNISDKNASTEPIHEKSVEFLKNDESEKKENTINNQPKSYRNIRPCNYATTECVTYSKNFVLCEDSCTGRNQKNSNNLLNSNTNSRSSNDTTQLIGGKGVEQFKSTKESKKNSSIPLKSYKNSRPLKNNMAEIASDEKCQGLHIGKDSEEVGKTFIIPSSVLEKYECSNVKANKKVTEECKTSHSSEEKNSLGNGNATIGFNSRKPSHLVEVHRYQKPSFFEKVNRELVSARKSGHSTNHAKQYDDKSNLSFQSQQSTLSQTYIQNSTIANRADRGHGRTFFNSNIPVRTFRSTLATQMDEKFRHQRGHH